MQEFAADASFHDTTNGSQASSEARQEIDFL
jgi:hypothetical protein